MISKIGLLWRTARHLKPIQIYGRFWFRFYKPRIDSSSAPSNDQFNGFSTYPARRKCSMVGPFHWRLLNEGGKLDELGWVDSRRSKLWRYNQHYFDDFNAFQANKRSIWHDALIQRWINDNTQGSEPGWEPYPTSLRIVNWIKWAATRKHLPEMVVQSLSVQMRWLSKRLEWHLLGNHLFANAKALIFGGLYFHGPEAQAWLDKGMKIIGEQLPEQVLADGGQFELSPMYHALMVEDILDLVNICRPNRARLTTDQATKLEEFCKLVPRMLHWLNTVSHPDGKISFFNDAAFGVAPENGELIEYALRLGFKPLSSSDGVTDLKHTGLVRMQTKRAVVIADLARIGPDYLPGHAHADTLSFELSLDGNRIFVNSGTSVYGIGEERLRQRGTSAHNTLWLKNQDSSEVWSGFRVGARANILNREVGQVGTRLFASASHDGYARTNGGLVHTRRILLDNKSLQIIDSMTRPGSAVVHYHLHPSNSVRVIKTDCAEITTGNGRLLNLNISGASKLKVINTTWHPEFGIKIANQCLSLEISNLKCNTSLNWE